MTDRRRPAALAGVVAVLTLAVSACGGGDEGDAGDVATTVAAASEPATTTPATTQPASTAPTTAAPSTTAAGAPADTAPPATAVAESAAPAITGAPVTTVVDDPVVVSDGEVAELERALDDIDQILADLEADLAADTQD